MLSKLQKEVQELLAPEHRANITGYSPETLAATFAAIERNRARRATDSNDEDGFTLIELIIVLAIIAILVVVAIPVFSGIQNTARQAAVESSARTALITTQAAHFQGNSAEEALANVNAQEEDIELTLLGSGSAISAFCVEAQWVGKDNHATAGEACGGEYMPEQPNEPVTPPTTAPEPTTPPVPSPEPTEPVGSSFSEKFQVSAYSNSIDFVELSFLEISSGDYLDSLPLDVTASLEVQLHGITVYEGEFSSLRQEVVVSDPFYQGLWRHYEFYVSVNEDGNLVDEIHFRNN